MLNGLLTLRGAWDKVRQDPMLKFMVAAVTRMGWRRWKVPRGHQERELPFALYRLDHCPRPYRRPGVERFPDVQHALLLIPRLYSTKLWSVKLANYHFWIASSA